MMSDEIEIDDIRILPSQLSAPKRKAIRAANYSQLEDIQLCESWENISLDPITGNEQPSKAYWKRIHDNFHGNRKFESDRNANSLEHRWATIHKECQNWNICLKLKMHMQANIQRRRGFLSFIVG